MEKRLIGDVCCINPRRTIDLPVGSDVTFIPMEAASTDGLLDTSRLIAIDKTKNYTVFRNGDVLFAKITPCMENGKGGIATGLKNGYGAGSTEFIVLRPDTSLISAKWLHLFLSQKTFRRECLKHTKGTAGQKRVPPTYLAECVIPIPSLTEQQRIVAKIEELFSELDNGIATLKRAKEQLSVYRQAVLKEYIEGSYNAKCNKYIRIKDFAKVGTGATPLKTCPKYYGGSIPWISSSKINEIKITTPSDYITDIALKETNCKLYPPHTILIAMYGEGKTRGKCAELMISAATNQALAAIELSNNSVITKDFLMAFLELNYQQLRRKASGGVQPNLNLSIIKDLKVPRYSLEEQKKIVFSIEYRFSHCSAIEKAVERSIRQAESLRQSILKQAFEGKLV